MYKIGKYKILKYETYKYKHLIILQKFVNVIIKIINK